MKNNDFNVVSLFVSDNSHIIIIIVIIGFASVYTSPYFLQANQG